MSPRKYRRSASVTPSSLVRSVRAGGVRKVGPFRFEFGEVPISPYIGNAGAVVIFLAWGCALRSLFVCGVAGCRGRVARGEVRSRCVAKVLFVYEVGSHCGRIG